MNTLRIEDRIYWRNLKKVCSRSLQFAVSERLKKSLQSQFAVFSVGTHKKVYSRSFLTALTKNRNQALNKIINMDFKELLAYQKSFQLAMAIFKISKSFPQEEKYSLTDQIRRCSRSVSANIAEAYRKRRYPNHFISKLTDSDAENSETNVWLNFSLECEYINIETFNDLNNQTIEVGRLINYMINNPSKFGCEGK